MSIMDNTEQVLDHLVSARAALERMRDDVHGGGDECGPMCRDYHDAMRAVSNAAEAVGLPVTELHRVADTINGNGWKYTGYTEACDEC
jgi:hypothetical protein